MNSTDPRHSILPKSDAFAEEYFSHSVVTSLIDLLPTDDKIAINDEITTNIITRETISSSCRHCHHYVHEGRRGGQCEQLNVPVQSSWEGCVLSQAIFLDDAIPFLFPIITAKSPEQCATEPYRRETGTPVNHLDFTLPSLPIVPSSLTVQMS
jgi:hypothetical protein